MKSQILIYPMISAFYRIPKAFSLTIKNRIEANFSRYDLK